MPDTKEDKRERFLKMIAEKRKGKKKKGVAPTEDKIREFLSHGRLKKNRPGMVMEE